MVGGFGGCALDRISLIDRWPRQEEVCYIKERVKVPGGMTLNALIASSRLGIASSYRGALGKDEDGGFILDYLNHTGVDTNLCRRLDEPTSMSLIMTDPEGKRTIFHQRGLRDRDYYPALSPGSSDRMEELKVLLLDGSWMKNSLEWAEEAASRRIPIVLDMSPNNIHPLRDKLLQLSDYPVLSKSLAEKLTSQSEEDKQVKALYDSYGGVCIVTNGEKGLWFCRDGEVKHIRAFHINPVDTNGAGDTFHGALAAALTVKENLEEALEVAMATAALKCSDKGHNGLRDLGTVEKFIRTSHREIGNS